MPDKVLGARLEAELGIHVLHRHLGEVHPLVGVGVLLLPALDIDEKVARAAFLEQAHER
jgi:hypothetical protein